MSLVFPTIAVLFNVVAQIMMERASKAPCFLRVGLRSFSPRSSPTASRCCVIFERSAIFRLAESAPSLWSQSCFSCFSMEPSPGLK
jgi:hypothetical protein